MVKVKVIIQSRTTSTRQPGKAFLPIKGIPVSVLCAKRAANRGAVVCVATSDSSTDDHLASLLEAHQINVFRGPLNDVLKRYILASQELDDADYIVRLTADNVFPDGAFIDEVVQYAVKTKAVYCISDAPDKGLPKGLVAEVFNVGAFRDTDCPENIEREHVTPWLIKNPAATSYLFKIEQNLSHLRCTLDTLEDYLNLLTIFNTVTDPIGVSWQDLCVKLAQCHTDRHETPNPPIQVKAC